MPRKKISHVHQYQRKDIGKKEPYIVYACALEGCTHYIHKDFIMGKLSLCNKCLGEFTLDRYAIWQQRVQPYCPDCRGKKEVNEFEELFKD